MWVNVCMTLPPDLAALLSEKDALINDLLAQVQAQAEQLAVLTARVAELEAKLNLPPKNPSNSSKPPSQGHKARARPSRSAGFMLGRTGPFTLIRRGAAMCWRSDAPTAAPT